MSYRNPLSAQDVARSPIRADIDLREPVPDHSPQSYQRNIPREPQEKKDPFSQIPSNLKSLYSVSEQLQGLEVNSSQLWRMYIQANYFLQNGLMLTTKDMVDILRKKQQRRTADRRDLKMVVYQEVSDYLAFVNDSNKIYLIKAGSLDVFQSFDVMGIIQAIHFHPYKRLWLAIATKNQVKILHPENSEEEFFSTLNPSYRREEQYNISKLERFVTLNITCTSLEFSPDGRYLAMAYEHSSTISLWELDFKRFRTHCEFGAVFNKIKWSPDGAYLAATCDKTQSLYIFEVSTWQKQKWHFKAPVNQMAWSCDANKLYVFLKETQEIREIIDVQLEKSKTSYERNEVEFRIARIFDVKLESQPKNLQSFTFCFEPERLRYVYVESKEDNEEVTRLGTISDRNDERVCERKKDIRPVRGFFFITKSGKHYDQKQAIIYKCYSKDQIETMNI